MDIKQRHKRLSELLIKYGQDHLLAFWDELDNEGKIGLLNQIERLDFSRIKVWVDQYVRNASPRIIPEDLEPPAYYPTKPADAEQERKYDEAVALGESIISKGKVAAFVVAGGQGTRLGFDGPKGNFPITPVKNKTLFRLFAESIMAVSRKYGVNLKWYVMASPLNYARTLGVFEENNYYGLDQSNVFLFKQGTLPGFDFEGRVLLKNKEEVVFLPDGHGGSLKALYESGAMEDMRKRGIEYISYFQVDNPLVNIFDPLFIGLHAIDGSEMSSKALIKTGPGEKVGNFCMIDGKLNVIEYSDLPDELAEKRNPDGSLVFQFGSIAIHIIDVDFIERLNLNPDLSGLPLHRAIKKIDCIDGKGRHPDLSEPSEPNGVKLETFVFDALPLAGKTIILQTVRSEEFAPVKNAFGEKSADASRKMMTARAAAWLESVGLNVPRKSDGSVDAVIEIAPGFALTKEQLVHKKDRIPEIRAGESVYLG
jgi:UDP-N-acetylglucosamine/UDP-N-acetylgalactosamine diphosphorylase